MTAIVPSSSGTLHEKRSVSPSVAKGGRDSQWSQDRGSANGIKNSARCSDGQTLVLVQEWSGRSVEEWNKIVTGV